MSWTVAGTVIGGIAGAPGGPEGIAAGARLGATIGSFVDILTKKSPHLFLDSHYSSVSYGAPMCRVWGKGRVDAQKIWVARQPSGTYLTEQDRGSKSKGQQEHHYFATYTVLVAETGWTCPDGTQIERPLTIDRIYMGDIIVYDSADARPANWASGTTYTFGDYVTASDSQVYTSLTDSNIGHDPSHSGSPNFWQRVTSPAAHISFVQHPDPGTETTFTMAVDSTMATHDGIPNTQAYRGYTYLLISNQDLYSLGNTIPSNISVECHTATLTEADFLSDLCLMAGLSVSDFDFSNLTDDLLGFVQNERQTTQDIVTTFLASRAYDLVEVDGVVKVVKRGGAIVATIPDTALGASTSGVIGDRLPATLLADTLELPSSVEVSYIDAGQNFRRVRALSPWNGASRNNPYAVETHQVMTSSQAAALAGRLNDTMRLENGAEYGPACMSGEWASLAPGDPVLALWRGSLTRFRITKQSIDEGLLKSSLVRDEIEVLNQTASDIGVPAPGGSSLIGTLAFVIASPSTDLAPATGGGMTDFSTFAGFYVWIYSPGGQFPGQVWYSFDQVTWYDGGTCRFQSVFGTVTALANAAAPGYETAHTCTLTRQLGGMAVDASDQTSVAIGLNNALIGNEWVGIVGVGSPGSTQVIGTGLVRGMYKSPYTGHSGGEQFAMSRSSAEAYKVKVDPSQVGNVVYVQVLAPGQVLGDSPIKSCTVGSPIVTPSSVTNGTPAYAGSTETVVFTAILPSAAPSAQTYSWEYSTDGGSTWSTATPGGLTFAAPGFTTGTMRARVQPSLPSGAVGAWVSSTDVTYSAPAAPFQEVPSGAINGSNKVFTLSHTPISNTLNVLQNGLHKIPGTDYSLSTNTITFVTAPLGGDTLYAQYSF